jgi:hypothetical protein
VAISFDKKVLLKSWEKSVFSCGANSPCLGANGPRAFEVYLKSEVFGNVFWEKIASGRIVCGFTADNLKLTSSHTERCAAREVQADGPRPSHGWSARPWQTVCRVLADSPPDAMGDSDSRWLRIFTVGIQTRTVCEGITDSPWSAHFWHSGQ